MRKKILTIILAVTIIIQIAVPTGMLIHKSTEISQIKKYGQFHTFSAYLPHYYRGDFTIRLEIFGPTKQYVTINQDANGTEYYEHSDEKPSTPVYIDRYIEGYETKDFSISFPEVYIRTEEYENLSYIDFQKKMSFDTDSEDSAEKVAVDDEGATFANVVFYNEATVDAYILKGKIYIEDVYIDGVDIKTVLEGLNNK
ncbi:MAG: hypothetical protein IJ289_08280 [Clostridia bacterium]|nr:hypothetical protein [Clostridia bacterium]